MALMKVHDKAELQSKLAAAPGAVVGFFGEFSQPSRAARAELERCCAKHPEQPAFFVDVGETKDVHGEYGVTSVPTVLIFKDGRVMQKLVGAQRLELYERAVLGGAGTGKPAADGKPRTHQVIVYTTDTCPWCTRVKAYLRQNAVSFRELNVGRDESAARRMVAKSGQHGVPQLDIDGHVVVGFDRGRIDSLLGLSASNAA